MAETVSLGRPYARSICSIFRLCMESNALGKSTNKSVASSFFCTNSYDSTDCQNLWCCESLSPKTILILSKNFLNVWWDEIEKQSIINLSRYICSCWWFRGHFSRRRRGCNLLSISLSSSGYIRCCSIGTVSHRISLSSILLEIFHRNEQFFCF